MILRVSLLEFCVRIVEVDERRLLRVDELARPRWERRWPTGTLEKIGGSFSESGTAAGSAGAAAGGLGSDRSLGGRGGFIATASASDEREYERCCDECYD